MIIVDNNHDGLDDLVALARAAAQAIAARPGHHDDCAWRPRLTLGDARRLVHLFETIARENWVTAAHWIPDCACRTSGCGHPASQHTGGNGECWICGRACWS